MAAGYAFSEASGTTTADASGNNNTGTLNGATRTTAGQFGNALVFNGSSAFVDLGNPATLQLTGSMTVSAWIKSAAFPADDAAIVSRRNGTGLGYQLDTTIDTGPRTIGFKLTSATGTLMARYGATAMQLNQWYHVTGVYDAAARTLNVYLNGVLNNGTLLGTVTATQQNSPLNVNIGRRPGDSRFAFNGTIDEVRIYNRALSQAEIQADMATPAGGTPPPPDTTTPGAPAGLGATAASATQINLAWTASTDNVGVTGYRVERCQGSGCTSFAQFATPTGTSFSDTGLIAGTSYSYRVRAADAAGNLSGFSNIASTTTQTPGSSAPTAPTGLSATAVSGNQINLNWTASTDDVGVTAYRVEQCQGAACTNFTEIATVDGQSIIGPLSASANPNYFKDARGNTLALNGSHTWNSFQDWGSNGSLQTLDFTAFVNFLVAHGHNFTLLWRTELPTFCGLPTTATSPPNLTVGPHPWLRTGPGNATDGALKFDLTKFDQGYFDRLRARVQALNNAGVYAGVYLFSGEWLNVFRCASDGYPFTGANNINGIDDGYTGGSNGVGSMAMTAPNAITAFQDTYVQKVIDTLNDLPNVLWIVSEEAPTNSTWWNDHQIAQIRSYESGKPFRHPIGYATLADLRDSAITNSNADWIAPAARISPTTSCGTGTPTCKVSINDSDHNYFGMWKDTAQENRNYAWENFTTGNQVVFMDPYVLFYPRENRNVCPSPTNAICPAPDARWNNFRNNLGYITAYSRRLNLANVTPRSSLCSTSFCLAQTPPSGAEYLIYAPSGGPFTVNLSAMSSSRTLTVEWFNPSTGTATLASPIPAGSPSQSFTPPFGGDAVLYLVDSAGHAGAAALPTSLTSYQVTGLAAGAYGYRVRAGDTAGNLSPYSNVASATTLTAADTTPPTAPTVLSAAVGSSSQIDLSWTASTDNVGVTGYQIDRCQGTGCTTFVQIATATITSFSDIGLAAATTYRYRVRATDAAGNVSANSSIVTATTQAVPDTTPPSAPAGLSAAATSSAQISLAWAAATDNVGVTGYRTERCQGAGCSTFAQVAAPTSTSFNDTGLSAGTSYSYQVRATDAAGNLGAYSTVASATTQTPDTTAPTAPAGLAATAASSTQINLAWSASTDNVGVTGYRVERCQGAGCTTFAQVATPTATSFGDSGLIAGTSYSYRVRAADAAGNLSAYSSVASATTSGTLSGLVADYAFSEASGTTTADASGNNNTGTLNGATRTTAGQFGNALVFNGSSAFVDLGNPATLQLTGSMTVSAWIKSAAFPADDAAIVSRRNGTGLGYQLDTTIDTGPRTIGFKLTSATGTLMARYGATAMQLNQWYHVTGVYDAAARTLNVYLNGVLNNGTLLGTVTATQQNSPLNVNIGRRPGDSRFAFNGTIDEVRIYNRALSQAEIQADMATPAGGTPPPPDTTTPGAPAGLGATAASATQINLAWTASTDNVGVTGYRVERCQGSGCTSFAQFATPTGTSFSDTGLIAGTSYSYQVRAADAAGNLSAYSNVASATTSGTPPAPPALGAFPLVASGDQRYLQDQNGVPFPILGRTAWFVTSLSETDYKTFLDDTAAKGYNAIEFHVVNHDARGNRPPFGANGTLLPFTKRLDGSTWTGSLSYASISAEAPDFSLPNEAYWTHVDALLAYAESKGILCFMFPAYAGFSGGAQGWMAEMVANGSTRMQAYGAFIANRYKTRGNIVWMLGGDYGTGGFPFTASQLAVERAMLAGMKSVAGQASLHFSAEWNTESIYSDQADATLRAAGTLEGVYSFSGNVNTLARNGYAHSPAMPTFLLEEPYDQEGPDGNGVNGAATQPVRRFQWWGWLSGIGGYISGNGFVWPFNTGVWTNHLNTQGAQDMARLNAFVRSIPWYNFVPSGLAGMKTLVTAGGSSPASSDYVAAAATPDGTLLVAYVPPAHSGSITIDMTAMSGPARARWFNPASAAFTLIGTFANTGTSTFTPPGNNGTGFADWALLLEKQ